MSFSFSQLNETEWNVTIVFYIITCTVISIINHYSSRKVKWFFPLLIKFLRKDIGFCDTVFFNASDISYVLKDLT
jgi:hypothetical protein